MEVRHYTLYLVYVLSWQPTLLHSDQPDGSTQHDMLDQLDLLNAQIWTIYKALSL